MLQLSNRSPFFVWHQLVVDREGYERLLVVVKASFHIDRTTLVPMGHQVAVEPADVYRGDPSCSSILAPSDLALDKPGADLLLFGSAYPARAGDRTMQVEFQVGDLRKRATVWGDRYWRAGMLGGSVEGPAPLESVPLVYERAFGGIGHPDNPSGTGFLSRANHKSLDGLALPNIEHPKYRITSPNDRPPPCGFGPIAPHWPQRRRFAGTYDAVWRSQRMPLPPTDFDPRFEQSAPEDQILRAPLRGDEPVHISGVQPGGEILSFRLPGRSICVTIHDGTTRHELAASLDTLQIHADDLRCELIWRTSLHVHQRIYDVAWIRVEEREGAANV